MNTSPKIAQQPRNFRTLSPFKTVFGLLFISLLMVACVTSQPRFAQQQVPESRVALVVGNAKYASQDITDLSNPSRDARDMAQTLRQVGFEVIEVHDADESTMKTKFEEFGAKLKATPPKNGKKVALFYYSGHGALKDGKSYLISVDAHLPKEENGKRYISKSSTKSMSLVEESSVVLSILILGKKKFNWFNSTSTIFIFILTHV